MDMRLGTGYKDNICYYNRAMEKSLKDHTFALLYYPVSCVTYVRKPEQRVAVESLRY